jgi:hypothetical protein
MSMETLLPKTIFYEDSCFKFEFEIAIDFVNIHCTVSKFSPKVLRRMYEVFSTFKNYVSAEGLGPIVTITKNPQFALLFGGRIEGSLIFNGEEYEVVVWELNQRC